MAAHYSAAVVPARPRKPRDKAKAEVAVQVVERWIVAALRKRQFNSLGELNQVIGELLERINRRAFRKRSGSRLSLFESPDRPALKLLPVERYEFGEWKTARVNIDYHIEVERHYYSVPYQLVGKRVEVRLAARTIEIFHQRPPRRLASAQPGALPPDDGSRTPPQVAPAALGVDAFAADRLGTPCRSLNRQGVREDS